MGPTRFSGLELTNQYPGRTVPPGISPASTEWGRLRHPRLSPASSLGQLACGLSVSLGCWECFGKASSAVCQVARGATIAKPGV